MASDAGSWLRLEQHHARGRDEDLRYGPDVTTWRPGACQCDFPSLVTQEAGVVAGLDVALLTLNSLGTNGYRVLDRVRTAR